MTAINVYINFNGNCRDAMTFYHQCFGGELDLQTVAGSPIEAQCPTAMKGQILHSALSSGALLLMGSDMVGPDGFTHGNNIALALSCSSAAEIHRYFENLATGGIVVEPLKKEFWGATFGLLTDQFGIRWMLTYDEELQRN